MTKISKMISAVVMFIMMFILLQSPIMVFAEDIEKNIKSKQKRNQSQLWQPPKSCRTLCQKT